MLAERKRKKPKWARDPCNLTWLNDDSRYSVRLMKKMGWETGKGLGANATGMVKNIKARNTGKLGVGCSEGYNDIWLSHQFNFQAILNNLNKKDEGFEEEPIHTPTKTVQQVPSENCGIMQNYSKLTKGKDLSSIKGDDMVAIFGHSMTEKNCEMMDLEVSKKKKKKKRKLSSAEEHVKEEKDDKFLSSNQTTVDYFISKKFEQKLAALLNGTVWISKKNEIKVDESQQAEVDEDKKIENREVESPDLKKKKRKKKKKKEEQNEEISNKSGLEIDESPQEEELRETEKIENDEVENLNPKKKKRKKKLEDVKVKSDKEEKKKSKKQKKKKNGKNL